MRKSVQRKKNEAPTKIGAGSGNVFKDLGLDGAEQLLAKAQLAQRICSLVQVRRLNQAQAARLLGVDQPKVSALIHGRLDGFSTDRLFRFLNALGQSVEIAVRPARPGRADTRVISR